MSLSSCTGKIFWSLIWIFYISFVCFPFALLIFFIIFKPQELKITVTDASLGKFNFIATNNTLIYDITLNITSRNPNRKVGVHFDRIQVMGNYRKKTFAAVNLTPFYQGHKNTTFLHVAFQGQQMALFKEREIKQYDSETAGSGVYSIGVKLYVRTRVRYGKIKSGRVKSKIDCKLKVPLGSNTIFANGITFKATKCGNVHFVNGSD